MPAAIKAENLSKAYQLGEIGTGTISRDLERFLARIRGKEDPFLKIGEANDRSVRGTSDIVWSLKDLNFEIQQGDAVGIIGRNGAGKSTLLKILSRVTAPTTGSVKIKGRIASLLEVGTGFHPDLSGRENIYLNGAILGMRKAEIKRKFDEIVDFSGVERYIDTPVKRYSSGMYVRLAFAVAAHLESEIMIVDEVLAVGDAEFQKKCLGKMGDVSHKEGRTVLFVSHNMTSIGALCSKGMYLNNGELISVGTVTDTIANYLGDGKNKLGQQWLGDEGDESIRVYKTRVYVSDDEHGFHTAAAINVEIEGEILKPILGLVIGFTLWSQFEYELAYLLFDDDQKPPVPEAKPGYFKKTFRIPANTLAEGDYKIRFDVGIHMLKIIISDQCDVNFTLLNINGNGMRFPMSNNMRGRSSLFRPDWINENI